MPNAKSPFSIALNNSIYPKKIPISKAIAIPKTNNISSGIIIKCISLTIIIISIEINVKLIIKFEENPNTKKQIPNINPHNASKKGLYHEILSLHSLHFPLCRKKEIIGINSVGRNLWPHFGQCEGGETIDSPFGNLHPTTLKKDPNIVPNIKNIIKNK